MAGMRRILIPRGLATRLGRISLAGEVIDAEPLMGRRLRTLHECVVSVVTAGAGSYRSADGAILPITPRTITVAAPRVPHWYGTRPGQTWSELFVVFSGPLLDMLNDAGVLPRSGPQPLAPAANVNELALILKSAPMTMSAGEHQLWALGEWLATALGPAEDNGTWWTDVEHLLASDLSTKINISALAADLGLTYDTFRRRFAAVFGTTPSAYRQARRAEAAAALLRLTSLTTADIARRLGYSDEFHLSRRFRQHYGVPPSTYRRVQQG